MLCEKVVFAIISSHLYTLSYIYVQCYLPLWQLHSDFGDFNGGVCPEMKITVAESNPGLGHWTLETFCSSPTLWLTAGEVRIMTMSMASVESHSQVCTCMFAESCVTGLVACVTSCGLVVYLTSSNEAVLIDW